MKISSIIRMREKIIILEFTVIFITFNCAFSQWISIGSVTNLGNWPSVFVYDPLTIFVVGGDTGPVIWRSTNGGLNFTQLPTNGLPSSSSNRFLTCVFASSPSIIYVGDGSTQNNGLVKNAKVYKTTNSGTNWTTILSTGSNVNGFINGIEFCRSNPNCGVANSDPNSNTEKFKMWKTTDAGSSWTLFEPDAPNSAGAQNSVFYIDENFYGFGLNTANARVAITTNGGANFSFSNLSGAGGSNGFVSTVAFSNDKTNGLAGTSQTSTTISRTTNSGVNWFAQTIPCTITGSCNIKWVPETQVVYLVVSNSTESQCFKSFDNGSNWSQYTFPSGSIDITHTDLLYHSVLFAGSSDAYIFAANKEGTVYYLHESPMPVSLMSFSFYVSGRNVNLKWVTSEEINNFGFEVYRKESNDLNSAYKKIGFIKGNGNKSTYSHYYFEDKNVISGKYNYKIKQIDFNGNFEYYKLDNTVEILTPSKFFLSQNYPNPFNPVTKIYFSIPRNTLVTLKILDVLGKEITTLVNEIKPAGYYDVEFKNANLSSGTYFCTLKTDDNFAIKRMMLIK